MTPSSNPVESTDRCLLYLYDELSATDKRSFERELERSPALSAELTRQSELFTHLYSNWPSLPSHHSPAIDKFVDERVADVRVAHQQNAERRPEIVPAALDGTAALARTSHTRVLRYVAIAISIAAVGLVLVVTPRIVVAPQVSKSESDKSGEAFRIAEVWADADVNWAIESEHGGELALLDIDSNVDEFLHDELPEMAGPFGEEMVPSWMLAALEPMPESLENNVGTRNSINESSESESL